MSFTITLDPMNTSIILMFTLIFVFLAPQMSGWGFRIRERFDYDHRKWKNQKWEYTRLKEKEDRDKVV